MICSMVVTAVEEVKVLEGEDVLGFGTGGCTFK